MLKPPAAALGTRRMVCGPFSARRKATGVSSAWPVAGCAAASRPARTSRASRSHHNLRIRGSRSFRTSRRTARPFDRTFRRVRVHRLLLEDLQSRRAAARDRPERRPELHRQRGPDHVERQGHQLDRRLELGHRLPARRRGDSRRLELRRDRCEHQPSAAERGLLGRARLERRGGDCRPDRSHRPEGSTGPRGPQGVPGVLYYDKQEADGPLPVTLTFNAVPAGRVVLTVDATAYATAPGRYWEYVSPSGTIDFCGGTSRYP